MTLREADTILKSPLSAKLHSLEEINEAFRVWYAWWQNTDWNYRAFAKVLVVLEDKLGSESAVNSLLRKKGVDLTRLKNARRMVKVYDDYVRNGPATVDWFEALDWKKVTLINRATTRHDRFTLRREPIFDGSDRAWRLIEELGRAR